VKLCQPALSEPGLPFDGGYWSPDGTRIVFAHGDYEHSRIVTARSDGGDERRVCAWAKHLACVAEVVGRE
jgi:hypothetical protein